MTMLSQRRGYAKVVSLTWSLNTIPNLRQENYSVYQFAVRYCALDISICAATKVIYGVETCGIQVTATLRTTNALDQQFRFWSGAKSIIDRDAAYFAGFGPSGSLTEHYTVWQYCDGFTPLTAWPDDPVEPTLNVTLPACASPYCSISRTKFIAGVSSIPPGTVVVFNPTDANFTNRCPSVIVFNPCVTTDAQRWDTTTDSCGKPTWVSNGILDSNYGEICSGGGNSLCGAWGPDKVSRTRTVSDVVSHPRGTVIYDPSLGDWTLTL